MQRRPTIPSVRRRLLRWFHTHRRDLPWRHTRDPYRIAVSEVMLQQTQVERVVPKYQSWLQVFPTTTSLARAPLRRVLGLWSGLGYNARGKRLRDAASIVQNEYRGRWPRTVAQLERLPGFGPYTARAVASFAFHQDHAVIDTNVRRVIGRIFFGQRPPTPRRLTERVESLLPRGHSASWNAALMDFGSAVCTSRTPKCVDCPLRTFCRAYPTILEVQQSNVNRRSARFIDSDRYWRGAVVRALLRRSRLTSSELQRTTGYTVNRGDRRFRRLVETMVREGIVSHVQGRYSIAK